MASSVRVAISNEALDSKHRQQVAASLPPDWSLVAFDERPSCYESAIRCADAMVGWPPPESLQAAPQLRLLQLPSAGYESYLEAPTGATVVCNAANVMPPAVVEHCLALMLAFARRLPEHLAQTNGRRWGRLVSSELGESTVCIVGLGHIGTELARRCKSFGMTVAGVSRTDSAAAAYVDQQYPIESLQAALADADYVVIALPGGEATRGLVDAATIRSMKRGARLINVGRGTTLDQAALVECLRSGQLAGAGIDVWEPEPPSKDSPLWELDNVIITSHSAGTSELVQKRLAALVVDNLARLRSGSALFNQVIPTVEREVMQ